MNQAVKIAAVGRQCVACGCCVKACRKGAIRIESGVIARIDGEKCVGCGKCAKICPADVITILPRRIEGAEE